MDSGSTLDIIDYSVFEQAVQANNVITTIDSLGRTQYLDRRNKPRIISASKQLMESEGTAILQFNFGPGISFEVPCVVVRDFQYSVILGIGFLKTNNAVLIPASNQLLFYDQGVSVDLKIQSCSLAPVTAKPSARAFARDNIVIPAHSKSLMAVQLAADGSAWKARVFLSPKKLRDNFQFTSTLKHETASAGSGVVAKDSLLPDSSFEVQVYNSNPYPVNVVSGQKVGEVHNLSPVTHDVIFTSEPAPTLTAAERIHLDKLHEAFQFDDMPIDSEQKSAFDQLLRKHLALFPLNSDNLGCIRGFTYDIDLEPNSIPFRAKPFRCSQPEKQEIARQVSELLRLKIIRPSMSPWASPVILIPKPDGSLRFCIDYRRLNKATVKFAYPVPDIQDHMSCLNGQKYFCTLDQNCGYWQVGLSENAIPKTAFICHKGTFEFTRLPFGATNAVAYFQRMNEMILHGLLYTECLVYLDDIIIYGKDFQSCLTNLSHVLERFAAVGATFKVSKCKFFLQELTYLGGTVTSEGVKCAGSAQQAVLDYTRPCNITQLRRFLGLINYYSRFIRGVSQLVAPLTRLTTGANAKISRRQRAINLKASGSKMAGWDDECEKSFETLKTRLVDPELLRHPDYTKPFILTTDASDVAAAAVLSQLDDDGVEHPVGYYGHVFDDTERRYSATKREAFAIKWACQKLRHFLHGRLFTIITDHQALRHLETCKDKTLQTWALEMQDLQYVIVHRPGKDIPHVDAFSRCFPEPDPETEALASAVAALDMDVDQPPTFVPPTLLAALLDTNCELSAPDFSATLRLGPQFTHIRHLQESDPVIGDILNLLHTGVLPHGTSTAVGLLSQYGRDSFDLIDGLVYFKRESGSRSRLPALRLLFIPSTLRPELLHFFHADKFAGHMSTDKTYERLFARYWWPRMYSDVRDYIRACFVCCKARGSLQQNHGTLQPIIAARPFDIVAIDLLLLPETNTGNKYAIVAIDLFTRFVELGALPSKDAGTVAGWFGRNFISRYGAPEKLISDQGSEFISHDFNSICDNLGIRRALTTTGHPQANGLVERTNRTLIGILKTFLQGADKNWDYYLPFAQVAINTTLSKTLKEAPYYLVFGRDPHMPVERWLPALRQLPLDLQAHRAEHIRALRLGWDLSLESRTDAAHAAIVATKRRPVSYNVGDKVWCYLPEILRGSQHNKLESKWFGPFTIINRVGPVTYRLHTSRTKRVTQSFHVERLKPFWNPKERPSDTVILNQHFAVEVDDLIADPAGSLLPPSTTASPPSPTITWGSATIDTYKPRKPTAAERALVDTVFEHDGQFWKLFYVNYHLGNYCVTAWLEAVTVDNDIVTPTGQTHSAPLQFVLPLIKNPPATTP